MTVDSNVQQLDDGLDISVMLTGILVTQGEQADKLDRIDRRLKNIEDRQSMHRIRVDCLEYLLTEIEANIAAKPRRKPGRRSTT